MIKDQFEYKTIVQGLNISNLTKNRVIKLFYESLQQTQFKNPAAYITIKLQQLFDQYWNISISEIYNDVEHSHVTLDNTIEFHTRNYIFIGERIH